MTTDFGHRGSRAGSEAQHSDRLRMKIWNKSAGAIVYDNQSAPPDDADPTTAVGTGSSIVIQP